MKLVEQMLAGDQRALARLMSQVERDGSQVPDIMKAVYPLIGKAHCVGITGPPGAGKSTITDRLTAHARRLGKRVGIVAVDPTSPFSGGAVLGDRIRMQQHYLDQDVFIRSMATRGSHGGLSLTAKRVIKLLDAFGKDLILIETVGVGQTELDIVEAADTTVVVLVPEAGDTIQTMKAGLMEIADIFVVNKADRDGADRMLAELRMLMHMHPRHAWWEVPVLATQAHQNVGIEALWDAISQHYQQLQATGYLPQRRAEQRRQELLELLQQRLLQRLLIELQHKGSLQALMSDVQASRIDPYTAVQRMLQTGITCSSSRQSA